MKQIRKIAIHVVLMYAIYRKTRFYERAHIWQSYFGRTIPINAPHAHTHTHTHTQVHTLDSDYAASRSRTYCHRRASVHLLRIRAAFFDWSRPGGLCAVLPVRQVRRRRCNIRIFPWPPLLRLPYVLVWIHGRLVASTNSQAATDCTCVYVRTARDNYTAKEVIA